MKSLLRAYLYFNLPWMVLMQSLLDGFSIANDLYYNSYIALNIGSPSLKACMFTCIIHNCPCFSFNGATCYTHSQCSATYSSSIWTAYKANGNRKTLKDPPNGLDRVFDRHTEMTSTGQYYFTGYLEEEKCKLYMLMNDFHFMTHRASDNYCGMGTKWEKVVADVDFTSFLRPLVWSCVPGSSCYAVIIKETLNQM